MKCDMGFIEIWKQYSETPADRQTPYFQPLFPSLSEYRQRYKSPKIRWAKDVVIPEIKQIFYEVREADKVNALSRLLDVEDPQLAIVFCHTKKDVDDVSTKLGQMGYNAGALHGDYTQARRDEAEQIQDGYADILVAMICGSYKRRTMISAFLNPDIMSTDRKNR
jgi:ATP-dependent RNA helicase DeaD